MFGLKEKASELWFLPVPLNYVTFLCNNWIWVHAAWGDEGGTSALLIVFEKRFRRFSCKPHVADALILQYIIYIKTRQPFWSKVLTAVKAVCVWNQEIWERLQEGSKTSTVWQWRCCGPVGTLTGVWYWHKYLWRIEIIAGDWLTDVKLSADGDILTTSI